MTSTLEAVDGSIEHFRVQTHGERERLKPQAYLL